MKHETTHVSRPPRRRIIVATVIASVAVAGGAVWAGTAAAERSSEATKPALSEAPETLPQGPPSAASEAPSRITDVADPKPLTDKAAKQHIQAALTVTLTDSEDAEQLGKALGDTATGDYVAELEAQWQELLAAGWTVTGEPRVVSSEIVKLSKNGARAVVQSCIDTSHTAVLDSAGEAIGSPGERATRSLQRFTLLHGDDGTWRVSDHSFPKDPAC